MKRNKMAFVRYKIGWFCTCKAFIKVSFDLKIGGLKNENF